MAVAIAVLAASPAVGATDVRTYSGRVAGDGRAVALNVREGHALQQESERRDGQPGPVLTEYRRAPLCDVSSQFLTTPLNGECPPAEGRAGRIDCGEDTVLDPLRVRERASAQEVWSRWVPVDAGGCGADVLPVLSVEDFRRLPLPAPVLSLQPDRGWGLVNIETIVLTDPAPVTLRTELLGQGVTVVARTAAAARRAPPSRGPSARARRR